MEIIKEENLTPAKVRVEVDNKEYKKIIDKKNITKTEIVSERISNKKIKIYKKDYYKSGEKNLVKQTLMGIEKDGKLTFNKGIIKTKDGYELIK